MTACPACDTKIADPSVSICPGCGATLGLPDRVLGQLQKPQDSGASSTITSSTITSSTIANSPNQAEQILYDGFSAVLPTIWSWVFSCLTLFIATLYYFAVSRQKRYKITDQRIVIEYGLLSKRIEQIDLIRVVDFAMEVSFGQRLVGTGTLIVDANDRSQKEVRIENIKADVRNLYEKLRVATERRKRTSGVTRLDSV